MKKLLKEYDLKTPEEYYDMIVESYVNGQKHQAINQFEAMTREQRKACWKHLWQNEIYCGDALDLLFDLI